MAASPTYVPIATTTLGSAAASYTFSSIPSTYTDLVLVISSPTTGIGANSAIQVGNSTIDTGSNYSLTQLYGTGSAAASQKGSNINFGYGGVITGTAVAITHFLNYSNTNIYKTWLSRGSAPSNYIDATVSMWRSTSAINTIKVYGDSGTYAIGSTFTLYGIAAA